MKTLPANPFLASCRLTRLPTARRRLWMQFSLAMALSASAALAADYNWNTTTGTWDTTTANWTGGGPTWVDGAANNAMFANTATASTVTLDGNRSAGTITIGNATNNYTLTGSAVTLNGTTLAFAGSGANDSQDHLPSQTVFSGSLNVTLSGNVTLRRGNLEFGGTGAYNVGNITTSGDWGIFRMSGSAAVNATALLMGSGGGGAVTGSFDLNGGTLTAGSITAIGTGNSNGNAWTTRNTINGTTLKASQSNNTFLTVSASSLGVVNGTDAGNNVWLGNGGVTFDSNGFNIGSATSFRDDTGATGALVKSGAGTLTLTGASTYTGATTINGGTLKVNGSLAAGSAVAVNGGGALGGTGTVNGPVTVAGGAGTASQGAVNLVDGSLGTLTLTHAAGLALGGSAGNPSQLSFDVGGFSTDQLALGANPLNVAAGGAAITISGVGVSSGNTYDLVTFGSGTGAGFATGSGTTVGSLTLANPNITFGVQGSLNVTDTTVQLVTAGAAAPLTAYWSGVKGTSWTDNDGANGNFTGNADGTGFVGAYPNDSTDVIFAANGNGAPANMSNTLGQDFAIYSLTFANGAAATQISGANQLTLGSGGITLENGNGGATLAMNTLDLAGFQTWANAGGGDLDISAVISGANGLEINNSSTGATIFSATNTFSGGLTLTAGTLKTSGAGTLGAAGGTLAIDGGTLDLNGTSQSVGLLVGTGGTILNNHSATDVTLTIGTGNATGGEYAGIIADHSAGTGTVALTKADNGTATLSGANSYTGKTTINGGTLMVGANEVLPNSSVVEINNGGKLNVQAFTETIAGLSSVTGNINLVQNQETGGADTGTLVIDTAGGDYTFDGILRDNFQSTGALALVKNGAGIQTVTATNNLVVGTSIEFTGGLTINGGTFRLWDQGVTNGFYTNGKVISTFASDVTNHGIFALENTGGANATFSKIISGSGAVTTAGLVTLSGANTYSGNTTVTSGTLGVNGSSLSDTGTLFINPGALVHVTGTEVVGALDFGSGPVAAGTYGATGSGASHIDDTRFTGAGMVQVGAVVAGYSTWAAANAGGQGPALDFDGDGVKNGVEYFMGETGSSFTSNPGVIGGKVVWPKDPAFAGTYTVQTSPDLGTWTNAVSSEVGDTVEFTVPTGMGKLFVRLSVTPN